jgi:hypothetical protein
LNSHRKAHAGSMICHRCCKGRETRLDFNSECSRIWDLGSARGCVFHFYLRTDHSSKSLLSDKIKGDIAAPAGHRRTHSPSATMACFHGSEASMASWEVKGTRAGLCSKPGERSPTAGSRPDFLDDRTWQLGFLLATSYDQTGHSQPGQA